MAQRRDLQVLLQDLIGSKHVYFQPPASVQMQYPCIVYKLDNIKTDHADNKPYAKAKRYLVTVIDQDPDSLLFDLVASLTSASFSRAFASDNLNHQAYDLYF